MKPNLAVKNDVLKTDAQLKEYVLSELAYEPSVKATDIGVLVKDGTLTLNGFVESYGEKWGAVRAAKRVAGIKAIADDVEVRLPNSYHHSDGDIAAAAASQIKWSTTLPAEAIKITVREGYITLEGTLEWWYQKNIAETAVKYLMGVKGVSNLISITPKVTASGIEAAITSAFERNALLDSNKIKVQVSGNQVTLSGEVRNHAELEEAERAAWAASGVSSVDNQLTVKWSWYGAN
jgi:osmotically-inducible protein OsmY